MSNNRYTRWLLASLLLSLSASQCMVAQTAYHIVEQEYLKTIAPSQDSSKRSDIADLEGTKQPATFTPATLTDYDQYAIALTLLKKQDDQELSVIDTKFIKKMELLCGSGSASEHLLSHLDRTQSLFGKLALANMLVNPTRSQDIIEGRQTFLKGILTSNINQEELNALFTSLRPLEADFLSYWHEEHEATKKLIDQLYFGSYLNFLNQSTLGLEVKTRLRNLGSFVMMTWPILPDTIRTVYNKGKQTRPSDIANIAKDFAVSHYPYPMAYKDKSIDEVLVLMKQGQEPKSLGDTFMGIDAQIYEIKEQHRKQGIEFHANTTAAKAVMGGIKAAFLGYYVWQLKKTYDSAQLCTTTTRYLHNRLINLATYIDTIKQAHAQLSQVDGAHNIETFDVLASYFNGTAPISNNAKQLFSMLNAATFKGGTSFFTITGRVLAAHKIMEEVKDEFAPFFAAAGELEAYYSVAKLYAQHQETKAQYCFVEFADSDKPYIEADKFWNPFIDANKVVTNDIVLNNYAPHHNVILTGPNTGGKSTVIKAVALNLLLAQTFGIAAADYMKLTPFAAINCYLNITDDIASGTSLFQAEVKRAKELVDQVRSLESDEFCFTILDEVFSGTNAEGGSKQAYKFADELGKNNNAILVIATHFGNMTELETNSNYKNLCVTAQVMENGTIHRPFKLEQGAFSDPENKVLKALLKQEGVFS